MANVTDYEFKLDQYHNNYANVRTVANGLQGATKAGNQSLIEFFEKKAQDVIAQEAKFFQAGVEAAGGDAKKFLEDVLKHYPDMKDSPQYQVRLSEVNAQHTGINADEEIHHSQKINNNPKLAFAANAAVAAIGVAADYKEAYNHINNQDFNYLTQDQRRDYAHVYTTVKLQQNATLGADPELGYSSFKDWAVKVNLHDEDWVKLDPTPVTQNNINRGLPASGIPNPLMDLDRTF